MSRDRKGEIYRIIYRSRFNISGDSSEHELELDGIIEKARSNNAKRGITGILMTNGGLFVQVLEGELEPLSETFEAVCRDLRHRQMELTEFQPIDERDFGDWEMAWVREWPHGKKVDLANVGGWQMVQVLLEALREQQVDPASALAARDDGVSPDTDRTNSPAAAAD